MPSCKARAIGRKPHCLNLNLQGWNRTLIATAPEGDAARRGSFNFRGPYPPLGSRSVANRFKGMHEAPTSCSTRPTSTERGIAYGARALGRRSPHSSRRSHDRPGSPDLRSHDGNRGRDVTGQDPCDHRCLAPGMVSVDTSQADLHPEEIGKTPPSGPAHLVGQAAARRVPPLAGGVLRAAVEPALARLSSGPRLPHSARGDYEVLKRSEVVY